MKSHHLKRTISIFLAFMFLSFNFLSTISVKETQAAVEQLVNENFDYSGYRYVIPYDWEFSYGIDYVRYYGSDYSVYMSGDGQWVKTKRFEKPGKVRFNIYATCTHGNSPNISGSMELYVDQYVGGVWSRVATVIPKKANFVEGFEYNLNINATRVRFMYHEHNKFEYLLLDDIVVESSELLEVSGISLNSTSISNLQVGPGADPSKLTASLTATIAPSTAVNKTVNWASSNTSVARVDQNGLVTAIGPGTAIITATSASNPYVKATANVSVSYVPLDETAINVSLKVSDAEGIKDSFDIGNVNVDKLLNPTILNGDSFLNVNMKGQYNYFQYQFLKQTTKPINMPTSGWTNLNLDLQQSVINNDVITEKQGYLNWRGYDVNHLATISGETSWNNPSLVFQYPAAATGYKQANVSYSWSEYGAMQSVVPYNVVTVDNRIVTVNKRWVSNSIFMTSNNYPNYDLSRETSPDSANYKEASKFWGYIKVPMDGTYYFGLRSDDGAVGTLTVDGVSSKFADMFRVQGTTWGTTNKAFSLKKDIYYPIYIEYFNWGGAANLQLKYSNTALNSTGSNGANIPKEWFYPSKNITPGEYSKTVFTGSSGVKFPSDKGDYYIAYKTGSNTGTAVQGFYGPFTIEGKTVMNVSKLVNDGNTNVVKNKSFKVVYSIEPPKTIEATSNFKDSLGNFKSTIALTKIKLQDTYPEGIKVDSIGNQNLVVNGQSIMATIPDISYIYNGSAYVLNPLQEQVKLEIGLIAEKAGNYTLSDVGDSIITYLDVNKVPTNGQQEFAATLINVAPLIPVITVPASGSTLVTGSPEMKGTCDADTKLVSLYIDNNKINIVPNGTIWSYTPSSPLGDGIHVLQATATDEVGNTSEKSPVVNIIVDTDKPALISVSMASNNANTSYAKTGDTITIRFEAKTELSSIPVVMIAGKAVTVIRDGVKGYIASYVLQGTETEGIIPFAISLKDNNGVIVTQISATTDNTQVTYLKTKPILSNVTMTSNNVNTAYAKIGDSVTVTFSSNTEIIGNTVMIAGKTVIVTKLSNNTYTAKYTLTENDVSGVVPISINFMDKASNIGTTVNASTDGTKVTFLKEGPDATISYSKNPVNEGTLLVTVTYSNPVKIGNTPLISINQQGTEDIIGQIMSTSVMDNRTIWTYEYMVNQDNDSTYKDGVATVSLSTIQDFAGNNSKTPTGTGVLIDTKNPMKPVITKPVDESYTNDNTPLIEGTSEPNSVVTIIIDYDLFTVNADSNGYFKYIPQEPLRDSIHYISAIATDPAGNKSLQSNKVSLTVDTKVPKAPTITTELKGDDAILVIKDYELGDVVKYRIGDGPWIIYNPDKPPVLTESGLIISIITDRAGNVSAAATYNYTHVVKTSKIKLNLSVSASNKSSSNYNSSSYPTMWFKVDKATTDEIRNILGITSGEVVIPQSSFRLTSSTQELHQKIMIGDNTNVYCRVNSKNELQLGIKVLPRLAGAKADFELKFILTDDKDPLNIVSNYYTINITVKTIANSGLQ